MVSPGTHLIENYESLSITNESQFNKQGVQNWKFLGLCVTRQLPVIWRQMPKLYYSLLKLMFSPSIYLKDKKD